MQKLRPINSSHMIFVTALIYLTQTAYCFAETEEKKVARIAKNLKSISDTSWNELTKTQNKDVYEVQNGDTLWDISRRLFGNAFYWPKIWSLNNVNITNPHIILPKQKLNFTSGSSENFPKLGIDENSTESQTQTKFKHEYDKIDASLWAPVGIAANHGLENYDQYGLEKEITIKLPIHVKYRLPVFANDSTIPFLGEIVAARTEGSTLTQNDLVFLKSEHQDLQVGSTYSVFSEPDFLRDKKSDRSAYLYKTTGEIQIIGIKDNQYLGLITKAYGAIHRGNYVYPLLPIISSIKPVLAHQSLEALVLFDQSITIANNAGQFQFIHLDRGLEDGIQVGNVFRVFEYYDPSNNKKITDSDFLVLADALVVHTTAQFSTAIITKSHGIIHAGDFGVLLTDSSSTENPKPLTTDTTIDDTDAELDVLDSLDQSTVPGIGRSELKELNELKNWKNESTTNPSDDLDNTQTDKDSLPAEIEKNKDDKPSSNPNAEQTDTLDLELDNIQPETAEPQTTAPEATTPDEIPAPDSVPLEPSQPYLENPIDLPPTVETPTE